MSDRSEFKGSRAGLIINPIAGMGGSVGLKGTDGERAALARRLGARPVAGERVLKALAALLPAGHEVEILACSGDMGENVLAAAGIACKVVYRPPAAVTTAADTRAAAAAMLEHGVDLVLFAGGDGTASDLLEALDGRVPMLGIPSGVKMHSAVFGVSPRAAGDVARAFLAAADREALLQDAEVMDRREEEADIVSPVLLGYARTPVVPLLVSQAKAAAATGSIDGACRYAVELIGDSRLAIIGPGTTMRRIKQAYGCEGTLLGVDAVRDGKVAGRDLREAQILDLLAAGPAVIVIGVVGGQGFLLGRGNQQLSAAVIRRAGTDNLIVVASMEKLVDLPNGRLLVDSGDERLDEELSGYRPVIVGYRRTLQFPVGLPAAQAADGPRDARRATEAETING